MPHPVDTLVGAAWFLIPATWLLVYAVRQERKERAQRRAREWSNQSAALARASARAKEDTRP